MARNYKISLNLDYLKKRSITINYRVVAGKNNLHPIQMYDLIYDEVDLKIRSLDTEDNINYLREVQK